jgi:hypothetical protein
MEFKFKDISYSILLSHIFPGLFLELETIALFQIYTSIKIYSKILEHIKASTSESIGVFLILFAFAALLGFVLDGAKHMIYQDIGEIIKKLTKSKSDKATYAKEAYDVIHNNEQKEIYIHFIENDLYYPYEAYGNIGLAMIPGVFILFDKLIIKGGSFIDWVIVVSYIIVTITMLIEAWYTSYQCVEAEGKLLKNFESKDK